MKTLVIAVFACLAVYASAKPSGIWGHGHLGALVGASGVVSGHGAAGPAGIVTGHGAVGPNGLANAHGGWGHWGGAWGGHDDGQWHGEGLLESQDWVGHHGAHGAAIIAPGAVVVGHGGHWGLGHHGHW